MLPRLCLSVLVLSVISQCQEATEASEDNVPGAPVDNRPRGERAEDSDLPPPPPRR